MFGESGEVCIFSPQIGYDLTAFLYMRLLGTFDVLGRIMERNKAGAPSNLHFTRRHPLHYSLLERSMSL